jgi:predicted DNA-binding transcriptional regulator AlpA
MTYLRKCFLQRVAAGNTDKETGVADDRLLVLDEISLRTRIPAASIRYKKHRGEMPFLFRLGRRVVCYESDLDAWIQAERAKATNDRDGAA